MEYLIVSATELEIAPICRQLQVGGLEEGAPVRVSHGSVFATFFVTGVGMMQTAYYLSGLLENNRFDHMIQAGIAGAFDRSLQLGEVVRVASQQYGDLGVFDQSGFRDVFDMHLANPGHPPFNSGQLVNDGAGHARHQKLKEVSAISVNTISSRQEEIEILQAKYNAQVEVLEGIAFHFAARKAGISYAEIRGVSNFVETRDKAGWDIDGAVEQLNNYLLYWLRAST